MERHVMTVMCVSFLGCFTLLNIVFVGISFIKIMKRHWQLDPPWHLLRVATIRCHLLRRLQGS